MPLNKDAMRLVSKYSDEILNVIEHVDEFTQSDLQGVVGAIVMNIYNERKNDKVDAERA